jgi:uncharacterized protein YjbI with pentapeptide repeats
LKFSYFATPGAPTHIQQWNSWKDGRRGVIELRSFDPVTGLPKFLDARGYDFTSAFLDEVILEGADLREAIFDRVLMWKTILINTRLENSSFREAQLWGTNFVGARLCGADMTGAQLNRAELACTDFSNVNLTGAKLLNIEGWSQIISIEGADITDIQGSPEGFRDWAMERGAIDQST